MMKKVMRAIVMLMVTLVMTFGFPTSVHAQETLAETQFSQFMTASQPVDAKTEPDDNAETAFSYGEGASVFVTGETANGWYIVFYRGMTGYINKGTAQDALVVEEIDFEALDEELEDMQIRDQILIEEIDRQRAETRRSRIWVAVIAVLVIGIFAVGIVSTIRAEKKKQDEDTPGDNKRSKDNVKAEQQKKNNKQKAYSGKIIDLDKE